MKLRAVHGRNRRVKAERQALERRGIYPKTCPSGKILYDAATADREIERREKINPLGDPLRRYFCGQCDSWHLTSQPPRQ